MEGDVGPYDVAITSDSAYVYIANATSNTISAFTVGSDGRLSGNGVVESGNGITGLAVSPIAPYPYTSGANGMTASTAFEIAVDGKLTLAGEGLFDPIDGLEAIAVDPSGRFVFIPMINGRRILVYAVNGGDMEFISDTFGGESPGSIAVTP